ncbi:hypothetical protein BDE02_11G049300 [Populus trichocarpa]|nr:hypothetical protein BDE02_11G049300 [Populus trichocarpa]
MLQLLSFFFFSLPLLLFISPTKPPTLSLSFSPQATTLFSLTD